uniref:Nucleolar protein 8 n=1 Tax=Gorilla gorilla gorilla TaxID=9595 RepID=A0A2I2YA00_GORGO
MKVNRETKRLYVGGLSQDISEADLQNQFSRFGEVSDVEIITRKDDQGKFMVLHWSSSQIFLRCNAFDGLPRMVIQRISQRTSSSVLTVNVKQRRHRLRSRAIQERNG